MWKIEHEAKMSAAGNSWDFWLTDEIKADGEAFNWQTGMREKVESTTSQRYFVESLKAATAADTVNLYINSLGGSVKEALGIYNTLKRCPAAVNVYIDGFAASAASVIAMAGDRVIMPRNTCMMLHNAAWFVYGNSRDLRKSAADLEVINMAAIQSYLLKGGDKLPAEQLTQMLDSETWLTAEDCMAYGLADEYAATDADLGATAERFRAARAASSKTPEGELFKNPPEFLAAALAKMEEKPTQNEPPEPEGKPLEPEGKPTPAQPVGGFITALMREMVKE